MSQLDDINIRYGASIPPKSKYKIRRISPYLPLEVGPHEYRMGSGGVL